MRRALSFSFARLGAAVAVVVAAACLLSEQPTDVPAPLFTLIVLGSAAVWAVGLFLPPHRPALRVVAFVLYGVAGALLDLWQPWGPGFVAGFVAVSAIALALPLRRALFPALPVLIAVGAAEVATSEHAWNALLNVLLGFVFFFAASSFAALSREASARAEQLLQQEAQTRAAREESAVLAERTRLARELHDVLAHTLSGLTLQLEAARLLAQRTGTDPRVMEQLDLAHRSARNGVLEGKRAIAALRGEPLPGLGDLAELLAVFSRDSGIPTGFDESGTPRALSGDAELAVFRTVQESLSNVRKHAPTSQSVRVRLAWSADALDVVVRNEATETAADEIARGFGLSGLGERAAALGGTFRAGPSEIGFETALTLPLAGELETAQ